MKLLHCSDCHGAFSISDFLGICPCGHCAAKQVQGTRAAVISGPAKVYAIRNADLKIGAGKFWQVKVKDGDLYVVKTQSMIQRFADEVGKSLRKGLTKRGK